MFSDSNVQVNVKEGCQSTLTRSKLPEFNQ